MRTTIRSRSFRRTVAVIVVVTAALGASTTRPTSRPAPGKLVCVGDSITAGEGVTAAESFVGRLAARAAAEHLDLAVVNDGRSGWTTGGYVHSAKAVTATVPADATVILILLGTNDAHSHDPAEKVAAAAAKNVERLMRLYHAKAPAAAFVLAGPTAVYPDELTDRLRKADYGDRTPVVLAAIRDAYRHSAERLGLRYVDLSAVPTAADTIDGVHPTAAGHAAIADAVWAALSAAPTTRP